MNSNYLYLKCTIACTYRTHHFPYRFSSKGFHIMCLYSVSKLQCNSFQVRLFKFSCKDDLLRKTRNGPPHNSEHITDYQAVNWPSREMHSPDCQPRKFPQTFILNCVFWEFNPIDKQDRTNGHQSQVWLAIWDLPATNISSHLSNNKTVILQVFTVLLTISSRKFLVICITWRHNLKVILRITASCPNVKSIKDRFRQSVL